jgi:hypothetical protein
MNRHAAIHELVLLDRMVAGLLERRARLVAASGLDGAALARAHADLERRTSASRPAGRIVELFERLDRDARDVAGGAR